MVLPYQADHVVIQLVLFEHGDGKIGLLHCHIQPEDRGCTWSHRQLHPPAAAASGQRPPASSPSLLQALKPQLPPHSPFSLSVLSLLLHFLGLRDVQHRHVFWAHALHGQL